MAWNAQKPAQFGSHSHSKVEKLAAAIKFSSDSEILRGDLPGSGIPAKKIPKKSFRPSEIEFCNTLFRLIFYEIFRQIRHSITHCLVNRVAIGIEGLIMVVAVYPLLSAKGPLKTAFDLPALEDK